MGVQNHHKQFFTKKPCRKYFTQNPHKNPRPFLLFSVLFNFVFLRGEAGNATKNIKGRRRKNKKSDVHTYLLFLRLFEVFRSNNIYMCVCVYSVFFTYHLLATDHGAGVTRDAGHMPVPPGARGDAGGACVNELFPDPPTTHTTHAHRN
jgi:hypothetical protein